MSSRLKGRDVLTLAELAPDEIRMIIDRAKAEKTSAGRAGWGDALAGRVAALIFMKPSLRTRVSFEVACRRLGMHPVVLGGGDAFSRNESVHDTVKVLERYVDVIVVRAFEQVFLEHVAEVASVPVVNALTDDFHPCQVLADLLTIEEHKGRLDGIRLTYVGDGNNMANTLMLGGALVGMHITVASPTGFEPSADVVQRAGLLARQTGAEVQVVHDPHEAVRGADVVVTDTWASMGQEAEHDARVRAFTGYTVDAAIMAETAEDAIFMHCLPAHRGEEVADEVIDAPYSVVFDEAENRLHVQQALLALLLE